MNIKRKKRNRKSRLTHGRLPGLLSEQGSLVKMYRIHCLQGLGRLKESNIITYFPTLHMYTLIKITMRIIPPRWYRQNPSADRISGPPHQTKALHTHVRPPIPTQGPSYPCQAPHTYPRPFKPILGLHNHPKPFTPISGPLYPSLTIHTFLWPFTPALGPPHQSQTFNHPRASIPIPDVSSSL